MTTLVFCYGTLKRGIHNHHLLKDSKFLGEAYTPDLFRMYDVGFPIIRPANEGDGAAVLGEVFEVDDETLKKLDRLENEGVMYDRKLISVIYPYADFLVEANVSVYIGNDKYWDAHNPVRYTKLNDYDELEWRQ